MAKSPLLGKCLMAIPVGLMLQAQCDSAQAQTQSTPAAAASDLPQQILITANKRPEAQRSVAGTVSVARGDTLLLTGPTHTNVMDLRVGLVM